MVYFYQMVPLFFIEQTPSDVVTITLANLFNMHFSASSSNQQIAGICPFPGMASLQEQVINFFSWIIIAIPLFVICLIQWRGWGCDNFIRRRILGCVFTEAVPEEASRNRQASYVLTHFSLQARVAVSLFKMALYTFSAVVQALFILLRCVPVAGKDQNELFVFVDPDKRCYQPFQQFLFFILSLVVLSPVALGIFIVYRSREKSSNTTNHYVMRFLTSPFTERAGFWYGAGGAFALVVARNLQLFVRSLNESLLLMFACGRESVRLLWRLGLILVFTFVLDPVVKLVTLTFLSTVMLFAHVQVRPFRDSVAQNLASLTLFVLVIVGRLAPATCAACKRSLFFCDAAFSSLLSV